MAVQTLAYTTTHPLTHKLTHQLKNPCSTETETRGVHRARGSREYLRFRRCCRTAGLPGPIFAHNACQTRRDGFSLNPRRRRRRRCQVSARAAPRQAGSPHAARRSQQGRNKGATSAAALSAVRFPIRGSGLIHEHAHRGSLRSSFSPCSPRPQTQPRRGRRRAPHPSPPAVQAPLPSSAAALRGAAAAP